MTRYPGYGDSDFDPEVLADLRFRDASEGDRTRSRSAVYAPAAIVEHWPCRKRCGAMVGVTEVALDAFEANNRRLVQMRLQPMAKHEVMWCPDCKRRDDELAALQRGARGPGSQTEIAGAAPREERPSWMPTPRAERRRNKP